MALSLVLLAGCGSQESAPAEPEATPAPPLELTAEQLPQLPPPAEEVGSLLGVDKPLRAEPNDAVSQVLEGMEPSETFEFFGYSYSAGNSNQPDRPFAAVGLLLMVGTDSEIEELFSQLTQEGQETSEESPWERVEVADASEAATSFVEVPGEGFVIDTTVSRLDQLLVYLYVLSNGPKSRRDATVQITELVLENARDVGSSG